MLLDVQKYNISHQIQGTGGTFCRGNVVCGLAEGLWQLSASSLSSLYKFLAWCNPGTNSHRLGKGSWAATTIITSKEEMVTEDWKEKPWKSTNSGWAADEERLYVLAALSILLLFDFAGHHSHCTYTQSCLQPAYEFWFLTEMRHLQSAELCLPMHIPGHPLMKCDSMGFHQLNFTGLQDYLSIQQGKPASPKGTASPVRRVTLQIAQPSQLCRYFCRSLTKRCSNRHSTATYLCCCSLYPGNLCVISSVRGISVLPKVTRIAATSLKHKPDPCRASTGCSVLHSPVQPGPGQWQWLFSESFSVQDTSPSGRNKYKGSFSGFRPAQLCALWAACGYWRSDCMHVTS